MLFEGNFSVRPLLLLVVPLVMLPNFASLVLRDTCDHIVSEADTVTPSHIADPVVMLADHNFLRLLLTIAKLPDFNFFIVAATSKSSGWQSELPILVFVFS